MKGLLKRLIDDNRLENDTRDAVDKIREYSLVCKKEGSTQRRFNLTIGFEYLKFNSYVQVDTMFLSVRTVVHMVEEATHYTTD